MPRPRQHTRIDDIRENTERELVRRGAVFENPNRDNKRYICQYIINKSQLAPYLARLGVRDWKLIAPIFFKMPGASFYRYIVWLYYLHIKSPVVLKGMTDIFKSGLIHSSYNSVRDKYYRLRRELHQQRSQSMNDRNADNEFIVELYTRMVSCGLDSATFNAMFGRTGHKGLYVVVKMMRGEGYEPALREYIQQYYDEIVFDYLENGIVRALLSYFHGVYIPNPQEDRTIRNTEKANDEFIVNVLGLSHDELNYRATEYQDDITRSLDLMEHWELLESTELYFEEEVNTEEMLKDLTNPELREILTAGSLTEASVPEEAMRLAQKLAAIHGPVTITSEASGLHIYIADPELLREDGQKELVSKHLSINVDKFLGTGQWDPQTHPTKENKTLYRKFHSQNKEVPCAISMKTKKVYMVSDLLAYTPIQNRHGLFANVKSAVTVGALNKRLVYDENGNLVPEWVGHTIPLSQLPANHPAIEYLTERGYDIKALENQFEACYCDEALPESRGEGRFYSRLPGGMKNTPQGRIILSIRMHGVRIGYQSRYIDKWVGNLHYFWSNEQKWVLIEERMPDGSIKEVYPADEYFKKGFAPHKYMNATGMERNKALMGFDAAVAFNADRPVNKRYCVLVEGPLDAARIGPPAIAMLGKSLSQYQAAYIRGAFTHVLTVMDNDEAGKQCLRSIHRQLEFNPITEIHLPPDKKDIGELSYEEAALLVIPHIPE